jgi:ribosomal protein S27E
MTPRRGSPMIELKCWGCGWDGHIPDRYAGLRVTCKRCGEVNVAPDSVTKEVSLDDWIATIVPASVISTAEIDCSILDTYRPPMA